MYGGYTAAAPTASDTTDEVVTADGIQFILTGGATIITENGSTMTITGAPVGAIFPFRIKRVKSTGLTANAVVLLFCRN